MIGGKRERELAWPFLLGGLALGMVTGALIGVARTHARPPEATDLHPPEGYHAAPIGNIRAGAPLVKGGALAVLATWRKPNASGGLFVARGQDVWGPSFASDEQLLESIEWGMKRGAKKMSRSLNVKHREMREISGRRIAVIEAEDDDAAKLDGMLIVGHTWILLGALSPVREPEVHREGFDAALEQIARLEPHPVGAAERELAIGKGAGFGFLAALLPSIGLAAIMRRRR